MGSLFSGISGLSGLAPEIFVLALGGAFAWIYSLYLTVLSEPQSKDFVDLRRSLERGDGLETAYTRSLRRVLMWADRFFEGKPYKYEPPTGKWQARALQFGLRLFGRPADYRRPDEMRLPGWRPNAWSARTYDRCLLLALVYPVLAAFVGWTAFGDGGALAASIGLRPTPDGVTRILTTGAAFALAAGTIGFFRLEGWRSWLAFAVALAGAFAIAGAGAVAFAFGFAVAVAGAGAVVVAFAFAFAGAGAVSANRLGRLLAVLSILLFVAIGYGAFQSVGTSGPDSTWTLLLAVGLLPLINAPFDWASIGLTRTLLYRNLDTSSPKMRFLWSSVDLFGALALLILLALTSVLGMEAFNAAALAGGAKEQPVDVAGMLADIGAEPYAARHFWLYFALFSTLLPTLIHCLVWVVSTATVRIGPLQRWLIDGLDHRLGHGTATQHKIAAVLTLRWLIPVPFVLGASIWLLALAGQAPWLGGAFLTLLQNEQMFVAAMLRGG